MTPSAQMTTGIVYVPIYHILKISISKFFMIREILDYLNGCIFLSDETAISII